MRRREFIGFLGGAATWPVAARAQQPEPMRRIAALTVLPENDPENKARLGGFKQELEGLGWSEGRNAHIDYYFGVRTDDAEARASAVVASQPDVIFVQGTPVTTALQHQTRTIPIVFVGVADPMGSGFIASLARPGGNLTGFIPHRRAGQEWWCRVGPGFSDHSPSSRTCATCCRHYHGERKSCEQSNARAPCRRSQVIGDA